MSDETTATIPVNTPNLVLDEAMNLLPSLKAVLVCTVTDAGEINVRWSEMDRGQFCFLAVAIQAAAIAEVQMARNAETTRTMQ